MDILRDDASSPTPPSGSDSPASPPSAPPAPSPAPEFRYGPEAGEFAGRTAGEVLALTQQALAQVRAYQPPVQQYQPQAPRADSFDVADGEYIDGATAKRMLAAALQNRGPDPLAQQALHLAASSNVGTARQLFADDFRRFGPEIDLELAKLSPDAKSLDNIKMIVEIVRGRHVKELIEEAAGQRAQQLLSQMEPTTRAAGGAGSGPLPHSTQPMGLLDQIPENERHKIVAVGFNETTLRAHLAEQGIDITTFLAGYGIKPVAGGVK